MDDNLALSNQTSDRRVTGAYSTAKVNAPEGSKRHQTYYDSESTPPKQRSIANTLVSACYMETKKGARPKTLDIGSYLYGGATKDITKLADGEFTLGVMGLENVTQRRQRATGNVHRSNDSDTDIDAINKRKPKKSSSMYTAELEENVLALKQRVHQLEESKQQEQIQQLCKNSASDSQLLRLREHTKILPIRSPLQDRMKLRLSLHKSATTSQQPPTDSKSPPKAAEPGKVMQLDLLSLPVIRQLDIVPEDEPTPDIPAPVVVRKQKTPMAKLEAYAGQGASLEAFLAKFESHSCYVGWTEEDQLQISLTRTAATVLRAGGAQDSSADLIGLLKNQHGSNNQTKCVWMELKARRRQPCKSLQTLYQDVRRLICLASLDEKGKLAEKMCIEAFTSAFADRPKRYDVLSKNPTKLEDALFGAVRYKALREGVTTPQPQLVLDPASYVYDDKGKKKESVRVVEIHQDKQRELEKSFEEQKSLNDENH